MSTLPVNPVMYLLSDPRVPMSKGKFGAQAAHAAMLALELSPDDRLQHVWRHAGGHYAKVVLQCEDLQLTKQYIEDRGFACGLVIDEGRTEFGAALTPTFLGVQIVDKNRLDVKNTFGQFNLYRDLPTTEEKRSVKDKIRERIRAHRAGRNA